MTQLQITYQLSMLTIIALCAVFIVFRGTKGYNVQQGVTNTTAPARVDTIEVDMFRGEINANRDLWKRAGYQVIRSQSHGGIITLFMTKSLHGNQTR